MSEGVVLKMPDQKGHQPWLIPGSFAIALILMVTVAACGGSNSKGNMEEGTSTPMADPDTPEPMLPLTKPGSVCLKRRVTWG